MLRELCIGLVHVTKCAPVLRSNFVRMSTTASDVFDREFKAEHRERVAHARSDSDPFQTECAERIVDKVRDVNRYFKRVLLVGGAGSTFLSLLLSDEKGKHVDHVSYVEQAHGMACQFRDKFGTILPQSGRTFDVQLADEDFLPFRDGSFDLVVACNSLHWVNDLEGSFSECFRVLQPDGMFLATLLGGDTLKELRTACQLAEEEREGGFSLRTSPLIHVRDAGILLSGARFALPTVDIDDITVNYEDICGAISHLRINAEQNAAVQRREVLPRDTALAAAALYMSHDGKSPEETVTSTFQLISCSGWRPDKSQQKPSIRGSGTVSLKDLPGKKNSMV